LRLALVLLMDSPEGETRTEGTTIDVSEHGCRIEAQTTMCEGQLIRVLPLEAATPVTEGNLVRMFPWDSPDGAMAGRVVWVGEPATSLAGKAGIEFLQPLPSMV
jgi:hypothetical protein